MPSASSTRSAPGVTVIVLNFNGERHLKECLPSLEAQDYPNVALMVADNGSSDGSVQYVRAHHPGVRVVDMGRNLGFAAGYNRAVEHADTDYVVLLNNDTRVATTWLSELVNAAARHGAAGAASAIVDWDGSHIDFMGGLPTFIGHAWQLDYGRPVGATYPEQPLLFGCAASLLIRRDAFVEARGFDEDFFAYFEDVDLGWRLNLLGHTTVLASKALTYHRLHGTFGALPHALRLRLYERNALATIFKNYGDQALARVLPAAVGLALARALFGESLDSRLFRFGAPPPDRTEVPAPVVATLIGLEDFARLLPGLRAKRQRIQATRRVAEDRILELLPEPLKLHEVGETYRDAADALIRDFRIAELFGLPAPAARVSTSRGIPRVDGRSSAGGSDRVSVIVLSATGPTHLPDCLDALRRQRWPADKVEIIVVDNGSAEDPAPVVARHCPGARVLRTDQNLGFSAGNNLGARVASGDWLAFLNDDTRVTPNWLDELMDVARRRQAASVGALMVDWAGTRLDFAGGRVNFEGRGFALHYDEPLSAVPAEEAPALFACGGAALFRRDAFEEAGGWDEPTFAYYEDVEFGWRLWLLGHDVWLAPRAVVHHKHHGTSGAVNPARARAFERNGLRMIYSLLETETLERVLPAALLLAADRVLLATPFGRADDSARDGESRGLLASLQGIRGSLRRSLIQRGARRSLGIEGNWRKLGFTGLAGAALDTAHDLRLAHGQAGWRGRYLIEQGGQPAALIGRREPVSPMVVAGLLGIKDFLEMLPELSVRRAWLQSRRVRSDADILGRFGDRWTAAVPSAHPELHAQLRNEVLTTFGLI